MRIAISGWFWDQPTTGSGQMVCQLLPALPHADDALEIVLVPPRWATDQVTAPSPRMQVVVPYHRSHLGKVWLEQIAFPLLGARLGVI